jgi:hypothetical protein
MTSSCTAVEMVCVLQSKGMCGVVVGCSACVLARRAPLQALLLHMPYVLGLGMLGASIYVGARIFVRQRCHCQGTVCEVGGSMRTRYISFPLP